MERDFLTISILIIIPLFLLVIGYYLYQNLFKKNAKSGFISPTSKKRNSQNNNSNNPVISYRLQAYERLVLLVERMDIKSLIQRVDMTTTLQTEQLPYTLIKAINDEFDYNVTQRIYVSSKLWSSILEFKKQTTHDILFIYDLVGKETKDVSSLINKILQYFEQKTNHSKYHQLLLQSLQQEAQFLMS